MLINFNHLKTFYGALVQKMKGFRGNWNQNDPTADDYIKNRPFYSEGLKKQTITLVDNVTSGEEDNYPRCNFVLGQSYNVNWDGVLYSDLVCYSDGDYNVIGGNNYPFCIDDDGGDGLYVSGSDGVVFSITTIVESEVIHKLDKKFIDMPDGTITEDNAHNILAPVATSNNYWDLDDVPTIDNYLSTDSMNALSNSAVTNALSFKLTAATNYLPMSTDWQSICYGKDKYVAIAGGCNKGNTFTYSYDGETWIKGTLPSSQYWNSICYGDDKFVIIAGSHLNGHESNAAAYSYDGITWTEITLPATNKWNSLCYGNGVFIATTFGDNYLLYSNDGINWTYDSIKIDTNTYLGTAVVCYGKDRFVAVSQTGTSCSGAYSYDGINWVSVDIPSIRIWKSICYGAGKFVAVANENNTIISSEDGIAWTESTLSNTYDLNAVCYGNGMFVAMCGHRISNNVYNKVLYSTDGITWTESSLGVTSYWQDMCYGNGRFIAISGGIHTSNSVVSSPDGINWTSGALKQSDVIQTSNVATMIQPHLSVVKTINNAIPDANGNVEVQSDWNASEGEAGHVKNRTHYEETTVVNEPLNITWDGNREGLVSAVLDEELVQYGIAYYKVSDNVFSNEQIQLMTETISNGAVNILGEDWEGLVEDGCVTDDAVASSFTFVRKAGVHFQGAVFPEVGVYAFVGYGYYSQSLTTAEPVEHTKTVVHKLDEKFIPDTIARTEELEALRSEIISLTSSLDEVKAYLDI